MAGLHAGLKFPRVPTDNLYDVTAAQGGRITRCEKLDACPFFGDKMACTQALAGIMKKRFCLTDYERGARYRVSKSGLPMPPDLFPPQSERADQLIAAALLK
jgi:hypothetical protein